MYTPFYPHKSNDPELNNYRLQRLNQLLVYACQSNEFYKDKLKGISLPIRSQADLYAIPFTTKHELAEDQIQYPPYGRNHPYPESSYIRYHQTSGTSGRPLKVLDTQESWDWWQDCWLEVLTHAGVTNCDRFFMAFSFGPFIGFWSAYEAAKKAGAMVIPAGGQTTKERLSSMKEHKATVLLCTPSYALHLSEVAKQEGYNMADFHIRLIITAGEPGGSIPSVRDRIEQEWQAQLFDHAGASEVGAFGYSCPSRQGIHLIESQFFTEIIDPVTLEAVDEGESGELVITNLGRFGFPVIRYRTGDSVIRHSTPCECGSKNQLFPGGIIGRCDDMVVVRGVNIFPQSIESIVREFAGISEFRIVYYTEEAMNQVKVQVESESDNLKPLEIRLRERIGLRINAEWMPSGSLPRFEMKSRRILDQRAVK